MELHSKGRTLALHKKTSVVGIINVTPDSYHPESRVMATQDILALAHEYIEGGADILEIGGESTGPESSDVSLAHELERVIPAVTAIRNHLPSAWISVDTCKSRVAHEALVAGANMINDITAGRSDEAMFSVLREAVCPVILMYSKDLSSRTTKSNIQYIDVIKTIMDFLTLRIQAAKEAGISQIIIDPGLGHFVSSDPSYSWEILFRLSEFLPLGPVLVSPSRKSFLAGPTNLPAQDRLAATLTAQCLSSLKGAAFIRTHDVKKTRASLDLVAGIIS